MAKALSASTRKPYGGPTRSLVVAIDIGTTFSGVSYAILEPGEIPKIHGVTRFPGQEHVAGNTKIPSIIYYDKNGELMAAGAEADNASVQSKAEDEGWIKVELFKLRLRPRTMQLNMNGMRFSPLPKKKSAVHVFGDYLAYLFQCTKKFIIDTHANGAALWNAVEHSTQFVLSHPNGWEGPQQSKMRRAAIYGGLIPDTNVGKARVWFVTEGEASLHACVLSGLANDVLSSPSQHGFLIADAGGGTLDISSYAIRGTDPLVIEEIAPPDCIFAGSVFVSRRAREFLEEKLKNSRYGTPDALDHITRKFDETTKRLFRDQREMQFIHFGSPLDKDNLVAIRNGQLKLTGPEVANLFEPSVDAAVRAIKAQIDASKGMIRSVFLVGGYAASPWLFSQLQERLARYQVIVSRPDSQTSKAVADGAIGFFCDHHVSARMSRFMYGVEYLRDFDPSNPDHASRRDRLCDLPSGPRLLPDAFDCILARGIKVKESTVFTRKYSTELTSLSLLSVFEVEVWCYRGGNEIPLWIDRHSDTFSTLCIVQADLSMLSGSAEPRVGRNGRDYWTIIFSVEIHFGLTEFKARIKWVDSGNTKYGPATIIYNEHGHRSVDEDEPDSYPEDDHVAGATPRSERYRSLPASRARTPTEPRSPSAYDGNNSYAGDTIRGVPPPAVSPHEFVRERAPNKPATPKATSPAPPSLERELSTDRRATTSKGKERVPSTAISRASSTANARIGETLTAIWGPGDPQARPPVQTQSPQTLTPQLPTPQPPLTQPSVQPPVQPLTQPYIQSPTQPPTQSSTQPPTPKPSTSKKSRKASANPTTQASPQPPSQPPPEIVAQPNHGSPKPPHAPAEVPAIATTSPKPAAAASPKSAKLPASRGLSHAASPSQRSENPLSPLNPSAQVRQPEPGLPLFDTNTSGAGWGDLNVTEKGAPTNGNNIRDFGDQTPSWNFNGDHRGFEASTGDIGGEWFGENDTGAVGKPTGDGAEGWDTLDGHNNPDLTELSATEVPGPFGSQAQNKDILGDTSGAMVSGGEGGSTVVSAPLSSLLNSSTVGAIGNRLSSTFGFGSSNKKPDGAEQQSSGFGSLGSLGFGFNSGTGSGLGNSAGWGSNSWGKPSTTTGSKPATPQPQATSKAPEQNPLDKAGPKSTSSNLSTPAPDKKPTWGAASKSPTSLKDDAPNTLASPKAVEQALPWGKKTAGGSKIKTPNPPASPTTIKQVADAPQPGATDEHGAMNELGAAIKYKEDMADVPEELAHPEQKSANPEISVALEDAAGTAEDDWGFPAKGKKAKKKQNQALAVTTPEITETGDAEGGWGAPGKGKKKAGKKGTGAPEQQNTNGLEEQTPAVDDSDWGIPVKGKKNKNKKGGDADFTAEDNPEVGKSEEPAGEQIEEQGGDDAGWDFSEKSKKKNKGGFADLIEGDDPEVEKTEELTGEQGGEQAVDDAGWGMPVKNKKKKNKKGGAADFMAEDSPEIGKNDPPTGEQDGNEVDLQAELDAMLDNGNEQQEEEEFQKAKNKKVAEPAAKGKKKKKK